MLLAGLTLAFRLSPGNAAMPQLFEGQLEVVDARAPEFPPPEQMLSSAQTSPDLNSTPDGSLPQMSGRMLPAMGRPMPAPEIASLPTINSTGVTWINSPPLKMSSLRGKVVLIDFWEYTRINCIRTLPENKKWWDRYHPRNS